MKNTVERSTIFTPGITWEEYKLHLLKSEVDRICTSSERELWIKEQEERRKKKKNARVR